MSIKLGSALNWRSARLPIFIFICTLIICFMYLWRLGTLTPGMSKAEIEARKNSHSIQQIINNPINAPHKSGQLIFQSLGHHGAFWMRSISVAATLLFLCFTFILFRDWFGDFIAVIGTLFFAATPWLIIVGRSATPDIMYLAPITIITAYAWLNRGKKLHNLAWIILMLSAGLAIYTPGVLWFVVIACLIGYKSLIHIAKQLSGAALFTGLVIFIILFVPLLIMIIKDTTVAKELLLIPNSIPSASEFAGNILWSVSSLIWRAESHMDYLVGRLAILTIAQTTLFILGLYAMVKGARKQTYSLIALFVIAILASALNNNIVVLTICLPAVAVLSVAGLRFLSIKWFKVFPRNPLPRGLAYTLIAFLVIFQLLYAVRYALIAWPHTTATKKTYVLK